MKRASIRQIAALARVMRVVVARIIDGGGPKSRAVTQALDLVEAWTRGEKVTKRELDRAAKGAYVASDRCDRPEPAKKAASWAFDAVAKVTWMAANGRDNEKLAIRHAGYGWLEPDIEWGARCRKVEKLYARALAEAAHVSSKSLAKPARKVDSRAVAALAAVRRKLGTASARLDRLGAECDPKLVATRTQLERLLERKQYACHAAVLAFDRDFGGLLLPTDADDDWRDLGDYATVGTYAYLRKLGRSRPRGGPKQAALELVPIFDGPSDAVVFLDARGRAFVQDLVADIDAKPFARDGRAALVKAIAWLLRESGRG